MPEFDTVLQCWVIFKVQVQAYFIFMLAFERESSCVLYFFNLGMILITGSRMMFILT